MMQNDRRRHLRIPVIDRFLQMPGTKWSAKQLLEKVNSYLQECDAKPIDIRTIQKDLLYLEGLPHNPAPIIKVRDGKVWYYRYEDRDYELEAPAINEDQLFSLTLAHEVLKQLKGFPLVREMELLRLQLEKQLPQHSLGEYPILLFEEVPDLKGIEYLEPLFEAIWSQTAIRYHYMPFEAAMPTEKNISPWWLKQSNQRWFLFGWDNELQRLDISPLDRIAGKIKTASFVYTPNHLTDPKLYFSQMVGVTRKAEDKTESVTVKVLGRRAHYMLTKPLHPTQKMTSQTNDGMEFSYQLIINEELISKLLEFGADIIVVAPTQLKDKMKALLGVALKHYDSPIHTI